jgi:spore coat polysaccharide biosynthesis protein SpsF (cytidylyltransferase family)/predicted dehydrogenase
MRFVATIEVRMGSSRLPGKSLADIAGKPLLERVIDRIKLCKRIDDIVVATSVNPLDDRIEEMVERLGIRCYRGSENDVLERVVKAAEYMKADVTVQFGGDSPFIDWKLVDELIKAYLKDPTVSLVTNCLELTYPLGIYTFIVPMRVMKITEGLAKKTAEREDATRYIWEHPEKFKLINKKATQELYRPELRLTVDYEQHLILTKKIYEELVQKKPDFTTIDIIHFIDKHPELKNINSGFMQRSAPHIKISQKIYKTAIIGCGAIAGGFDENSGFKHVFTHAGAYRKHPRFTVIAIADNNQMRLSEFKKIWKIKSAYTDYHELLAKEPVDLVSICVPDHMHASVANAMLESNTVKCIMEEKPIATDFREAAKLIKLCKEKSISLFINYNRLWDPVHRMVKGMISEGFLGGIQGCVGNYVRGIKHNGTAMSSAVRFLLGDDICRVQALRATDSEIDGDPALDGLLTTKSGVNVFLMSSDKGSYGHSIFEIDIMGNKGRIRLTDNGYKVEVYHTAEYKRYPGVRELVPVSLKGGRRFPGSQMDRTLLNTLDDIVLSLDHKIINIRHAEEAVKDMRIAEALIESLSSNGAQIIINDVAIERKMYV